MPSKTTFVALKLLPEFFPLIASHLPLYATPSTLLALALTNSQIYHIVHDLLYSRLILRNEKDAISIFQRLLTNPDFGRVVREIHVMSELTVPTMNGETSFDTVTGLKKVINTGALPYVHTFVVRLLKECHHNEDWSCINGFGHFPKDFWVDLQIKCPRVRTIVLSGIGDQNSDPWLHESGIYEFEGMKVCAPYIMTGDFVRHAQQDGTTRLLKNLQHLSSSLLTLILEPYCRYDSASPILSLHFPQLQYLALGLLSVPDTSEAMIFWRRHASIEKLKLTDTKSSSRWFTEKVDESLLPNLKYLEASFHDVRSLIPILPRLVGLSIQQSLNAQVPYLLRFLIPSGLPNLASLEIDQEWSADRDTILRYEGSTWYETPDGIFHEEKKLKNAARKFTDDYMHSIAKGAPNIRELCLHGIPLHPLTMEKLAPDIAKFGELERLYYRGVHDSNRDWRTPRNRQAFHASNRVIGEKSRKLERVTDISHSPYLATKIRRNQVGEVVEVLAAEGYGTIIGSENEAFPRNPDPIVSAG